VLHGVKTANNPNLSRAMSNCKSEFMQKHGRMAHSMLAAAHATQSLPVCAKLMSNTKKIG